MDRQVALGSIHGRCQGGGRVTNAKQRRVALVNGVSHQYSLGQDFLVCLEIQVFASLSFNFSKISDVACQAGLT